MPPASAPRVGPPSEAAENDLRALAGRRQAHNERRPAARRVRPRDAAAVAVDDPGDDGQPEARAALAALAPALGAPEALEELAGLVGGQAAAVVADLERDVAALVAHGDLDGRAVGRVDERVAHEVGQHL